MSFRFDPFLPWWALLPLAAIAVAATLRSYAFTSRPVPRLARAGMIALRIAILALILFCLARPVSVRQIRMPESGLTCIALDTSASMGLRDGPDRKSRLAVAGSIFAAEQEALTAMGKGSDLRRLVFAEAVSETSRLPGEAGGDEIAADGTATDLAAVLRRIAEETTGIPYCCALLITDGRHNAASDPYGPAAQLAAAGAPLYIIGVGQEATPEGYTEIQVRDLSVPEKAFVDNKIVVRALLESRLPEADRTTVSFSVDGKEVEQRVVELPKGEATTSVEFSHVAREIGMRKVTVAAEPLKNEANPGNNVRSAFTRIHRSKLWVRYVEGRLRWEYRFVKAALQGAPDMKYDPVIEPFLAVEKAEGGGDAEALPADEDRWRELKMVILGDVAPGRFRPERIDRLCRFVEEGGALLVIAGDSNLGPYGFGVTALAKALPVETGGEKALEEGVELAVSPAPAGRRHPILRVCDDPGENEVVWGRLPKITWVHPASGLKPAAFELVTAGGKPLLVVQEYGKGRTAVLLSDQTWRWAFSQEDLTQVHKRFWRNLVTWLTRSDYRDPDKTVFLDPERLALRQGEAADIAVHVQETKARAAELPSARIVLDIVPSKGPPAVVEMGKGVGDFRTRYAPAGPGEYRAVARVMSAGGKVLDSDEIRFAVEKTDAESDNPRANLSLLRRIAEIARGAYFDPANAHIAMQRIASREATFVKELTEVADLWLSPWMFAAFLLLLSGEWILRKRLGLV